MKRKRQSSSKRLHLALVGCIVFLVYGWFQLAAAWHTLLTRRDENIVSKSANKLVHQGSFGLGHRLSKLTAAYDLAKRLNLPILQVDWGHCEQENNTNIFDYLFQSDRIPVGSIAATGTSDGANTDKKTILIRNDVSGYYAGQAYKNFQVPITAALKERWRRKIQSDQRFLSTLFSQFCFQSSVKQFQNYHQFDTHTVIGVHIRAGNGEEDHFEQAKRGLDIDPHTFVRHLGEAMAQLQNIRYPLVFIATDTQEYTGLFNELLPYPVVSYEDQPRYESGVSYQQTDNCLENWKSSVIDMLLLSSADVLIATSRSTFTQIAPSLMVWRQGGRFCEYDSASFALSCFDDAESWLFDPPKAPHKVMVHLPDSEPDAIFSSAVEFLQSSESLPPDQRTFYYGRKYNKKYRQKRPFKDDWTWG